MSELSRLLKNNPLPWLLEEDNPSIHFWALVDLLERPFDDPEVQQARAAIAVQPLVREIFSLQQSGGYWGEDERKPYTVTGAVTMLSLLHMLGVPPVERTAAGCDSLLRSSQHECGGLSMSGKTRSGIFPCTTLARLPMLVYFGFGEAPRVQAAFCFLIEDMTAPDALDCGRYQHRDCLWGAISALEGLAVLPEDMRSERSAAAVRHLAEVLLDADYDFQGEHKRWLSFGVPRSWDLLSALNALAAHQYTADPRLTPLLERVLQQQDERGRWLCGSVSRAWPLERRGQPSKWVTLDALRLLKRTGLSFKAQENL